ncbi:hypothetical protein A9Q84_14995 [Halobacteriovorax marinus]|uniref:Secreted protein n=1 Tax=Halobacteriovorax marinus TaxID=97084 RepID=A0A1Y5FBM5_9BACT|nr:hypothetical protein A9Q84_14995 [Halobacteriovorax marinus]
MTKNLFVFLCFTIFSTNLTLAQDLSGEYTGLTKKGKSCSVLVVAQEIDGAQNYVINFQEREKDVFHSQHDLGTVEYYLEKYNLFQEEIIKKGIFGKKLYEVEIKSTEDKIVYFRVIRWRFLTGGGMATPFDKFKCFIK